MKERPILFKAPMVRAILDGSKTQTRRVVKQDREGLLDCKPTPAWDAFWQCVACPYGKPGDRLWVRETWSADAWFDGNAPNDIPDSAYIAYVSGRHAVAWPAAMGKVRASIHMPRWASRILLEVTDVRVERLQDISEADARAEGVKVDGNGHAVRDEVVNVGGARTAFAELWESINGPDSWAANPWVWVIEFRRVEP